MDWIVGGRPGPQRQVTSVLAWQQQHVVGEVEGDFLEREIGERDVLGDQQVPVSIGGTCRGGAVGPHGKLPDDEVFTIDFWVIRPRRHEVDQPVGTGCLGEVLHAFGVGEAAGPVPELRLCSRVHSHSGEQRCFRGGGIRGGHVFRPFRTLLSKIRPGGRCAVRGARAKPAKPGRRQGGGPLPRAARQWHGEIPIPLIRSGAASGFLSVIRCSGIESAWMPGVGGRSHDEPEACGDSSCSNATTCLGMRLW